MIFLLKFVFGQILDFEGTTYVDNCYPYQCNLQGICTNLTGNTYMCDCFTNYDGDNCEVTLTTCDNVDCGETGTCLYNDAEPICYCENGWERDDPSVYTSSCSTRKLGVSPCDVYDCGGKGECYILDGEAMCDCDVGWGGDTCSWQNQDIYNMFLLEMAALVIDVYPDQADNIAYDCSYLWPFVWDVSPVAMPIGEWSENVCAPCNCISAVKEVAADKSWDTLTQWRLDSKYKLNIEELYTLHCPWESSQDDVVKFTNALASFSDDCWAMVHLSMTLMPLYLTNKMTCSCLTSVVDYVDDVEEFFKYPLDLTKPYSSAYMNYQACTSDNGICDFEEIYGRIILESANIPQVSAACAPAVLAMAKSYVNSEYEDQMCTCMDKISTYCPECGIDWFSCLASSYDWLTVEDRFRQLCFSSVKVWREFAWLMNRYAMQLISVDVMGASSCSNAMTTSIARAQVPIGIDDKINQTLCACMISLAANGFYSAWDEIMAVAPTGFFMDRSECSSKYTDPEYLDSLSAEVLTSGETTQINVMVVLCALIGFNIILLCRNCLKKRSYYKLESSNGFNKPNETVTYKTTENK